MTDDHLDSAAQAQPDPLNSASTGFDGDTLASVKGEYACYAPQLRRPALSTMRATETLHSSSDWQKFDDDEGEWDKE